MPPTLLRPVTDTVGPWTTYGPKPPALGVNNASDTWGAGENCAFLVDAGSGLQASRLAALGAAQGALDELTNAMLTDGPWCPDLNTLNRYDADLLRARKIRVTLRVQVALASLRGPTGALFTRGGTARGGEQYIPDLEVRFDVTPRNMNFGR
jgi:hypothetical protein